ncbi:MAG: transporter substrate-binding domain-containing protein [Halopseudomonas aestusnigri]
MRGDGNYPPFEMMIEKKLTGLHIDIVQAVASRLKLELSFKSVPWKRAIWMVKTGTADAIIYIGKTEKRSEFLNFIEGNILSQVVNVFFISGKLIDKIQYTGNIDQLKSFIIGKVAGYHYGPFFEENSSYLKIDDGARTEEQLLKKLKLGRIDVGIGDIALISYL